jgi:hypothetical protein
MAVQYVAKGHKRTPAPQQSDSYSITLSALNKREGGTVMPIALAALRLITSSK